LVQDRIAQGSTPHITFQHRVEFDRLAPTLENAIYRIVQESLSNAIRHSQSERVAVELTQQGDWVRILVQDWGRGFRPAEVGEGCFGLEGIRERARLLGGTAQIDGLPGQGARIQVELPITLRETVT
jgi:signal transduction histidine kinase